jgi:transcriptional regulator with PAS, ATPase and Fis domain
MMASEDARSLREVVAAVSAALSRPAADGGLPGIFEKQVERLLSMRAVRLREIPTRYQARLVTPTRTSESIVVNVPTADTNVQAVLEASFERGRLLNERDFELLTAAAELGGLVLEAARTRGPSRPVPSDAAAPLVGSTAVMASLRDRVERVAATDFTVLIEGESSR